VIGDFPAMAVIRPPVIIDIEASGLGTRSYPIEIGAALTDGTKFCSLILPRPEWTHWDDGAQQLHRISRDMLETYGKPIVQVATQLNELLRQRTAYSDGWVVDKPWLDHLFFAAGMRCEFWLSPLEMILSEPQMGIWHATKDRLLLELGQKRHRASFDAYVVQETYERTWRAVADLEAVAKA
jgi:hypothetical protein